jgi:hypothetical protein
MSQEKDTREIGGVSLNFWKYFIPYILVHCFYLSNI